MSDRTPTPAGSGLAVSATPAATPAGPPARSARRAWVLWVPGLTVAIGAATATAHGLFEVAVAAGVPAGIAWLYPVITDGLALVAYAATARLNGSGRRYAWAVVVLAAGLSGLAQATYLASNLTPTTAAGGHGASGAGPDVALRFGAGAWPAIAAAIVAHLLFLLATETRDGHTPTMVPAAAGGTGEAEPGRSTAPVAPGAGTVRSAVQPAAVEPPERVQPASVQPASVQPGADGTVRPTAATVRPVVRSRVQSGDPPRPRTAVQPRRAYDAGAETSAGERARAVAARHAGQHGALPTATELMTLAEVSRGTAGAALKALRDTDTAKAPQEPLHLVTSSDPQARTQP